MDSASSAYYQKCGYMFLRHSVDAANSQLFIRNSSA